ncbi:MAG: hypothetical protein FJZ01_16765 [Candidatus Sericytochromatia bacterium]|nr:hypothetical protein [Candidatus Tanganyikabacteria bacterium]
MSPLPAYDTARFGWEHGGPYAGAPVIPALLGFAAQAASPLDGLLDAAATAAGNHLIVVGGRRSEAGTPVQATYAAPVGADGSLGTVVRLADLAVAVARPALLFTGRYLYAIGGEASGGPTATIQRAEWVGGALLPFEIAAYLPVSVWPPVVASSGSMAVVVGAAGAAAFRIEPDLSLSAPAGLALRSDGRSPSFAAFAGPWLFLGGGGAGDYLVADCTADPAALAFHRWAEEPDGPAGGHRAAVDGATVWLAPDTRAEVGVVGLGSRGPTAHLAAGWALADPRRKHAMAVVRGTLLVVGGTPAAPPEGARILAP